MNQKLIIDTITISIVSALSVITRHPGIGTGLFGSWYFAILSNSVVSIEATIGANPKSNSSKSILKSPSH